MPLHRPKHGGPIESPHRPPLKRTEVRAPGGKCRDAPKVKSLAWEAWETRDLGLFLSFGNRGAVGQFSCLNDAANYSSCRE